MVMKKLFCLMIAALLLMPQCFASVTLVESPDEFENGIAAGEFGAKDACFSPFNDDIYFLDDSSEGTQIVVFDSENSDYKTVKTFSPEGDYLSISVDADESIYLLRRDMDETAKSGIICLKKDGDEYVVTENLFPGASGDMIPVSFEFSPFSSMGYMRFWLNSAGDYISFVSPISVFWGSLLGYDELIYIVPGELIAGIQPMSEFFDAYGYQTEAAEAFLKKVEAGEYLSTTDASLSPSGTMLLLTVPYLEDEIVYVMDLYSYQLEIIYLPDGFSGEIKWTEDSKIQSTDENGNTALVEWDGFPQGEWGPYEGFDLEDDDWNFVTDENLSDWS